MNQKEFEQQVREANEVACNVCRRFGMAEDASADVVQDTMLRLWTLHDDLPDGTRLTKLAAVVARHRAVDLWRRQRRTVGIDALRSVEDSQPQPDKMAEHEDNMQWLEKRLRQLPSTEYQILRLRQKEGKTNEEIAAILGITVASTASLLSKARHKLLNDIKRRMKK
ncbi:MAG: RNA polymerase sigma factor [Prevotella sp.]